MGTSVTGRDSRLARQLSLEPNDTGPGSPPTAAAWLKRSALLEGMGKVQAISDKVLEPDRGKNKAGAVQEGWVRGR